MVTESVTAPEAKIDTDMLNYELVVIITPDVLDEKLDTSIESLTKYISEKGGVVAGVDKWGKKKFAYPIKHKLEGHYILIKFAMKPTMGRDLEGHLRISEDLMRYLLINIE